MKGHNMFLLRIRKLSLNCPQYPLLSGALVYVLVGSGTKICAFCEQSSVDEDSHGKLLSSKTGLSAHYFCMVR